jgi:hypothetical protein
VCVNSCLPPSYGVPYHVRVCECVCVVIYINMGSPRALSCVCVREGLSVCLSLSLCVSLCVFVCILHQYEFELTCLILIFQLSYEVSSSASTDSEFELTCLIRHRLKAGTCNLTPKTLT